MGLRDSRGQNAGDTSSGGTIEAVSAVMRLRQPLVLVVLWRTVAKVLSMGFVVIAFW